MQYPQTAYVDTLQIGITSVALSMTVTTAGPARTGGILTIGRAQANREDVFYTNVAGNVVTISLRGLSQTALTPTEVAGNKKVHAANESVEMTTHHNYVTEYARLDEANTFDFAPSVPGLLDPSGNEAIDTPATASAVNQLSVVNSATGNPVILTTAGGDSNINLELQAKGTGIVVLEDGVQTKTNAAPTQDKDVTNKLYVDTNSLTAGSFQGGTAIYAASTTGNDTYVIALTPALTSYTDGMTLWAKVDVANTDAATLNAGTPGAKAIVQGVTTPITTGAMLAGRTYGFKYSAANDNFVLFSPIYPFTAKGQLLAASAADTPALLPVGTMNKQSLTVDSAETTGLKYVLMSQLIGNVITPVTVANTVTETTLMSVSIPANFLGTANSIDVVLHISNMTYRAGADNVTIRFKYGGNTYLSTVLTNASATATAAMNGLYRVTLFASGAAAQIAAGGADIQETGGENSGSANNTDKVYSYGPGSVVATDSTVTQTLLVSAQWSAADTANSITMSRASVNLNA